MEKNEDRQHRIKVLIGSVSALALAVIFFALILPGSQKDVPVMGTGEAVIQTETDPLSEFLLEREQIRNMEIEQLSGITGNPNTGEEMRSAAQEQLMRLADSMEKEAIIEGVLRSRGYPDAVATVNGDSVNVLIRGTEVSREDSALILSLVMKETGVSGGNVKIIPIK